MDAIQFGQWISKQRRLCGWGSQRAFIEVVRKHPMLHNEGISEDFLARLEAGHLQHPFRGNTRRRVLALAYLLCKTTREVQTYQRAAELNDLNADETELLADLTEQLGFPHAAKVLLLPPRPRRFCGRTPVLRDVLHALRQTEPGIYLITGMPGVGKSALAAEAVHLLSTENNRYRNSFPDGIITLSGKGYQGTQGLIAFCNKLASLLSTTARPAPSLPSPDHTLETNFVIDHTRTLLAGKRTLLLLDDLDPQFPLRQALEVLRVQGYRNEQEVSTERAFLTGCTMLITSRVIPHQGNITQHFHLESLTNEAGLGLFETAVGRSFNENELAFAQQVVAAVGSLPQAIELAADAMKTGISCALLADQLTAHPLDALIDSEGTLHKQIEQALEGLPAETRAQFIQLALLKQQTFSLAEVTEIQLATTGRDWRSLEARRVQASVVQQLPDPETIEQHAQTPQDDAHTFLVSTAMHLTRLVRNSLIELEPQTNRNAAPHSTDTESSYGYYSIHPVLHSYARELQQQKQAEILAFAEHYYNNVPKLKQQRDLLLASVAQAWYTRDDAQVVRLMHQLILFSGHLHHPEGEYLLRLGIRASENLGDHLHVSRFLNRLGKLRSYRGDAHIAEKVWRLSLEAARLLETDLSPSEREQLAKPWINLSLLALEREEYDTAIQYVQFYLQECQIAGEIMGIIHSFILLGIYTYQRGDLESSEQYLQNAELFLPSTTAGTPSLQEQFARNEIALQRARIHGNYDHSQIYCQQLLVLGENWADPSYVPDIYIDQAEFAYKQALWDEAHIYALRSIHAAKKIEATLYLKRGIALLQNLPGGRTTTLTSETPFP